MEKQRFEQLWKALITDRVGASKCDGTSHTNHVSQHTIDALVAYGDGKPSAFDTVEKYFLAEPPQSRQVA
jgi:hypothetical protein